MVKAHKKAKAWTVSVETLFLSSKMSNRENPRLKLHQICCKLAYKSGVFSRWRTSSSIYAHTMAAFLRSQEGLQKTMMISFWFQPLQQQTGHSVREINSWRWNGKIAGCCQLGHNCVMWQCGRKLYCLWSYLEQKWLVLGVLYFLKIQKGNLDYTDSTLFIKTTFARNH